MTPEHLRGQRHTRPSGARATSGSSPRPAIEVATPRQARDRWPELADLAIRHSGQYAYIDGKLSDGTTLPLFRLRYGRSANSWGFAIHLASREGYQDSVLPSGCRVGTPEEALDCACGLYLNDPTSWTEPPTTTRNPGRTLRRRPAQPSLAPTDR